MPEVAAEVKPACAIFVQQGKWWQRRSKPSEDPGVLLDLCVCQDGKVIQGPVYFVRKQRLHATIFDSLVRWGVLNEVRAAPS